MLSRLLVLLLLGVTTSTGLAAPAQTAARHATLPSLYDYPTARLPIVYGRSTPPTQRLAQQGKAALRGCLLSGCD